jgi:hypothetical protein
VSILFFPLFAPLPQFDDLNFGTTMISGWIYASPKA